MSKSNFKFLPIFLLLLFIFGLNQPAYAKKTFWEAMFGPWLREIDNGPKPEQTLQAPFADDPYKMNDKNSTSTHSLVPITQPNMEKSQISKWLMTAISEAMTYTLDDQTSGEDKPAKVYFTPAAWKQMNNFKAKQGFEKVKESQKYNVSSFVQSEPLLLNATEHEGRYRWLYEVPIMMSVMDAQGFDYKENESVNQEVVVVVQIGRYPVEESKDGVLIESIVNRGDVEAGQ